MKFALASKKFINNDIIYNLNCILESMKEAKTNNARFICFGETFLQGFDSLSWNYENDKNIAISQNDDIIKTIINESINLGIGVMFGYIEKEDEFLYSSYLIIDKNVKYNYRRITKGWKEYSITDHHYKEGNVVEKITIDNLDIVIALCGDLWDKTNEFKILKDLLIWPIYVNYSIDNWNNSLLDEYLLKAQEVSKKTLLINSFSNNPDAFGGSYYFNSGNIEKSLDMGIDGILYVNIEK